MADVEYRQDSPYVNTQLHGNYLDVLEHRQLPYNEDDVLFTLSLIHI